MRKPSLIAALVLIAGCAAPAQTNPLDNHQLTARLPERSAAVVTVRCTPGIAGDLDTRLLALILKRDGTVTRAALPRAKDLDARLHVYNIDPSDTVAAELRRAVLDPILAAAGDIDTLYLSLDESLELVPWDALPRGETGLVGERIRLHRLRSLFDLEATPPLPTTATSLLVVGDSGVPATFGQAFADAAIAALDSDTGKAAVLAAATGARFVHFAVPTYFDGTSDDTSPESTVTGLSPLALTGFSLGTARVSAEDLLGVDLASCELATIGASGGWRGMVREGQGRANLVAALSGAGARQVLAALWPVDPTETERLMLSFYRRLWRNGAPAHRALWDAKMERRKAGVPFRDWAGWVLEGVPIR